MTNLQIVLVMLAGGCARGHDGGTTDASPSLAVDASPDGTVDADPDAPANVDLCPTLPIPPTCHGRSVIYRDHGPNAVGDGTYFADQAPLRLGFNRQAGSIWIVKVHTEADTYAGRISAYGDNTGGLAWISNDPCDASFAVNNRLVTWGNHGGGSLNFVVARNDADAARLATDPAYASYNNTPQLRGGGCYYAVFQNTSEYPASGLDLAYINTVGEACGNEQGCYYLAFDLGHRLHTFDGHTISGNVIPGLTVGP